MATSHGEGGGGGGAGGAFLAISAASGEGVRPATISNGKATRFITIPFLSPSTDGAFDAPPPANPILRKPAAPTCAALKLVEFFNFATEQPRLNRGQVPPFYAFVGKLYTLSRSVAVGVKFVLERLICSRQLFFLSPTHSACWKSENIYRAKGHQRASFEEQIR